jgi:hypothetical protein
MRSRGGGGVCVCMLRRYAIHCCQWDLWRVFVVLVLLLCFGLHVCGCHLYVVCVVCMGLSFVFVCACSFIWFCFVCGLFVCMWLSFVCCLFCLYVVVMRVVCACYVILFCFVCGLFCLYVVVICVCVLFVCGLCCLYAVVICMWFVLCVGLYMFVRVMSHVCVDSSMFLCFDFSVFSFQLSFPCVLFMCGLLSRVVHYICVSIACYVCVVVFNLLSCLCVSYVMCFYGSLVGRATGSPIIWCMYMCVLAVMCLFVLFVVQCVAACVHVLNVLCVFMTCVFKFVVCVCWFVVFVL